jgi:Subtilase family/Secretion system C-terminal sorting domain
LNENKSVKLLNIYEPAQLAVIECTWAEVEKLLQSSLVTAVDSKKKAKEELLFGFVDYACNKISTIQNRFPLLDGNTISLSVKEQKFDTTDIDFKGRILPSSFSSLSSSSHASIMATMIAGGGNAWYNTKGAAWGSTISSASFDNLLPEPNSYYQSGILVQNHSYGTIVENYYGPEAAGYDASVVNNISLIPVFSAGNSGTLTSSTGNYAGIPGYSNLTGNFKQAKNIITVGHIDSTGTVLSPSSKGPAYDGRVKPELVAFGEDGSSGATALVSGVAAVLHQTFKEKNGGIIAPASLIKAVLLNSAEDVDAVGIDFKTGYGNLNALKAVKTIVLGNYFQGAVSNNTQQQFFINIPSGIKQLKLTLVWTDPQAIPNSPKALVNDLDLELYQVATNTNWLPWVLNITANSSSLQQLPVRKRDSLNVAEQITVDFPASGNYIITVKGFSISTGTQNFSIAYQLDSADTFTWLFPTSTDHLFPTQTNLIRFESSFAASTGIVEMSIDKGNSWQIVSNSVDLTKGFLKMQVPDIFSNALLRMKINSQIYTSDTFTISKRLTPVVGLNCTDSFMIVWPKVKEASSYQLYRLGNLYMEPFQTTTDTFAIFSKTNNPIKHYAIAPMLQNKAAIRTYTFNYELQGTGCYIKSFLANLNATNEAELKLLLGTTYNIKSISFEKQTATGFSLIEKQNINNGFSYQSLDQQLHPGSNIYRVLLELADGRLITTPVAIIYFIVETTVVLYPNPVQRNGTVTVLSKLEDQLFIQLIDNLGRVVLQKKLTDELHQISTNNLQKGIYYYRIIKADRKVQTGRLIIN